MKQFLLLIIIFIVCLSCNKKTPKIEPVFDFNNSKTLLATDYKHLPNEKYREVVSFGDYYIFSREHELHIYDKVSGDKNILGTKGRGPKENLFIWNLKKYNNLLYLLDVNIGKISLLDIDLKYVDEKYIKFLPFRSFSVDKNYFIFDYTTEGNTLGITEFKNLETKEFHKKIIPTGYKPSEYNNSVGILFKDHIYVKNNAIDTIYVYDKFTQNLIEKNPIHINYNQETNNPPVEPFIGEYTDGILSFFGIFEMIDDNTIIARVQGQLTLLKKIGSAYYVANSIIFYDHEDFMADVSQFYIDGDQILAMSRSLDYTLKIPLSELMDY